MWILSFTCTDDLKSFHKPSGISFSESKSSTKLLQDKRTIKKNIILIIIIHYGRELYILSAINHTLLVLTLRASQPQEEHFHTAGRGIEMPGRNSAGQLCTLPPAAEALPLSSNGLHIPEVSAEREPQLLTYWTSIETLFVLIAFTNSSPFHTELPYYLCSGGSAILSWCLFTHNQAAPALSCISV